MNSKLQDIKILIHNNVDINNNVKLSLNNKAVYLRIFHNSKFSRTQVNNLIKKLPDTIKAFEYEPSTFIFVPFVSDQNKIDFEEVKCCLVGEKLLEKQKEVYEIQKEFKEALVELKKAKDKCSNEMKVPADINIV